MTIRLEITGADINEFAKNALNALALVARSVQAVPAGENRPVQGNTETEKPGAEIGGEKPGDAASGKRGGRRGKAAEPKSDEKPADAKPAETNVDPLADLGGEQKPVEPVKPVEPKADAKPADGKPLTLDGDVRPRMMAIRDAHAARGNDTQACVDYIVNLLKQFGVAKASDLPSEKFSEFMETSKGYLDGSVKVEAKK